MNLLNLNIASAKRLFIVVIAGLVVLCGPVLQGATIEDQIMEAEVFPEPLMWVGTNAPTQSESDDLWTIVTNSPSGTWQQDLLGYISNHSGSPWTPSVRANLAIMCRQCGAYSGALQEWDAAWQATKTYTNGMGKTVGDTVIAYWSQLLASLGRTNQLKPLFDETVGRTLDKPHLEELWRSSKEGYRTMVDFPELAYRCGTFALISVARALQITNASIETLKDEPSSGPGFSMTQLASLAQQRGLNLVGAVRTNGTNLAIPSVIHWSQNHYATIITNYEGAYWIKDPTFGGGTWMHRDAVNIEASGKFLVVSNQLPSGYRLMTQQEMDSTWGRGQPNNIDDWKDLGCDKSPGGRGAPCKQACPPCAEGMPRWWVTEPYINLWVADEPVSYTLSNGERFSFRFTYKQRRNLPVNQYLFPTRSARTTNTLWDHNFLSHLQYRDPVYDSYWVRNIPLPPGYQKFQNWEVMLFVPGGGFTIYASNYPPVSGELAFGESRSRVRIEQIGNLNTYTSLPGFPQSNYFCPTNPVTGFRVTQPDGSQEIYSLNFLTSVAVPSSPSRAEAVLTMRIDPSGRTTRLCYEGWFTGYPNLNQNSLLSFVRVKHVIDPDGRTNTVNYFDGFYPAPTGVLLPKLIREIEDPYGRKASFILYGSPQTLFGFPAAIIDSANNTNYFTYDRLSTNGLLQTMITPYGTTAFVSYDVDSDKYNTNQGNLGGHDRVNRSMAVGEPNGAKHLFMYRYDSPSFLPASLPTNQVPPGTWEYLIDNGGASGFTLLSFRNSFHWAPKNFPMFGISSDVTALTSNDFRTARWRHWLDSERDDMTLCSDRVSLERAPAPDSVEDGHITWFSYRGKFASHRIGSTKLVGAYGDEHQVGRIAEVLPDGSTRYDEFRYWSGGEFPAKPFPREVRSTYTMTAGSIGVRSTVYVYNSNNIDLQQVYGPDGDLEETYTYNTNHQVLTYSNAVAETYSFAYDANTRQLTSISTPSGLAIALNYYPSNASDPFNRNMLASIIESPINRANLFTYTNGLPHVHTNELGLRMVYTRDELDRLTSVNYPDDGTFTSNRYSKLDLVGHKDRSGNWTLFQFDAAQRLTAVTNANTNVTRLGWCGCGALEGVTNALNQPTSFVYDNQSRRTLTILADGSSVTNRYDQLGRLTSVIDGAGRALNLSYNNQGLLAAVSNAFGRVFGAVYDKEDRPLYVTDAAGITVTNAFDNLNRLTNRAWPDGGQERTIYSFAATNVAAIDPLGRTNRSVFDAARRLLWHTNANKELTSFAYNPAGQMINLLDGKGQLTVWNYDVFGRATNKIDALTRELFRFAYDALNRVTNRWMPTKGNTGYAYDPVGNLKTVTYSNANTLNFAYDAANRMTNMADVVGNTRFAYTAIGQLQTEDGPWTDDSVTLGYTQQQRTSLSLLQPSASAWSQSYGYDAARRLETLTSPAGAFGYGYTAGTGSAASDLIRRLTLPNGSYVTNAYDLLAQLQSTTLKNHLHQTLNAHGYGYDLWGQRTNSARFDGTKIDYRYDAIGQLIGATGYESNGTARLNEKLGYAYDAANNLLRRTNATLTHTYNTDADNRLTTATRAGTLTVAGMIARPVGSVSVNGQSANAYKDQTFASAAGFTLTNGVNAFTVTAQDIYGTATTNTVTLNLPDPVSFTYDTNGNLTADGLRVFDYDADNQLTNITVVGVWRSQFVYDGLFRRRIRREFKWSGGAWTQTNEVRYVCDGDLVLQERDASNVPLLTLTRGLDLSGSRQRVGGIGGLLARSVGTNHAFFHADGSGNITALMDSREDIVARYLYDPFGNPLGRSGPLADANLYRFSSKEQHGNSGLYYYGMRYYEPNLQRWLNQDPLGERGGVNLYGFVGNSPPNQIDPLGLEIGDTCNLLTYLWPSAARFQGDKALDEQARAHGYSDYFDALDKLDQSGGLNDDLQLRQRRSDAVASTAGNAADLTEGYISGPSPEVKSAAAGAGVVVTATEVARKAGLWDKLTKCLKREAKNTSKIDRAAFKTEREAFWKAEAKANPSKYSAEDMAKMENGRAPTGPDGFPVELHHTDRTPEGGLQPMSRTDHRLGDNYKKNHP